MPRSQRLSELESGIAGVLQRLSELKLSRPRKLTEVMFTRGEVDALLTNSYRLREFARDVPNGDRYSDVAIDIVRSTDGSLVVLPATAVS